MNTFEQFEISEGIKQVLSEKGFTEPTPIQCEVIPLALLKKDIVALAPTGSGKTIAYGIPSIESTDAKDNAIQTLILCPTRELAVQVETELKKLGARTDKLRITALYGGQNIQVQFRSLRKKPQIVVGTPGRLLDHLRRKTMSLKHLKTIVLDEADEMLNMGFRSDIDDVLSQTEQKAQVLMFSATMSKDIRTISTSYQSEPVSVTVATEESKPDISQFFVTLKEKDKLTALEKIRSENGYEKVLVFCNTKHKVDEIHERLKETGANVSALHGDMTQHRRDAVMRDFRSGKTEVLIATDVAARGLDVSDINAVFNYDVPTFDEFYVHRIGRTARAKKTGAAYTFCTASDTKRFKEIQRIYGIKPAELSVGGLSSVTPPAVKKRAQYTRIFVSIGKKDGLDEASLKKFVSEKSGVALSEIADVALLDTFSFVETEAGAAMKILTLSGSKYKNRTVNAELSTGASKKKPSPNDGKTDKKRARGKPPYGISAASDKKRFDGKTKENGRRAKTK